MEWMNRLRATQGRVGFWAKPLDGEATGFNEDLPLVAASVVKVPPTPIHFSGAFISGCFASSVSMMLRASAHTAGTSFRDAMGIRWNSLTAPI